MTYKVGYLYRFTQDYVAPQGLRLKAGGGTMVMLTTEGHLYLRSKVLSAAAGGIYIDVQLTMPIAVADQFLKEEEIDPVLVAFDPDPATWYGKHVELVRDVPALNGTIVHAGTLGLEVLGFEGKDLLIGWRTSYVNKATGEVVDGAPVIEQVLDERPAAVCRVPASLFWVIPARVMEATEQSPVGEEQ